jgi:5-methylcytosine-specific restriction endonuclease McrA
MDSKTCTKCLQAKPAQAFSRHSGKKSAKSERRRTCKDCDVLYNREYRALNRAKVNAAKREWAKDNIESIRAYDRKYQQANPEVKRAAFIKWSQANPGRAQSQARAWREANRERKKTLDRAWAQGNKDRVNAASRLYRANNPEKVSDIKKAQAIRDPESARNRSARRRARIANNGGFQVTTKEIARLLREPCAYCGAVAQHIDHVVPIARGGAHSIGNLVGACSSCNLRKGSKFLSVWRLGNSRQQERAAK